MAQNYTFKLAQDEIIVGDERAEHFKPHAKLKRWAGECFLNVAVPTEKTAMPITEHVGEKITKVEWQDTDKDVNFYPVPKNEYVENGHQVIQNDQGGFEFEIVLKKKPASNVITLDIETQGLKFYYQPELTQQEIDMDCFRPENVIGSYAVYHETQDKLFKTLPEGEKYGCGKAFHIYRPKVIDAEGNEIWGELRIDEQQLTININQSWLDNAMYPVTIDPTFGYDSIGGTNGAASNDYILGSLFTGAPGTGTSMTIYCISETTNQPAKGAIFKHSDSSRVAVTEELTIPDSWAWRTFNFSTRPVLEATGYVLICGFNAAAAPERFIMRYDAGDVDQGHYEAITYPTLPDPATFSHTDNKFSIYCTYVPIAAIAMRHYRNLRET